MIRLAIRVARADAEIALAELLELAPAGVEEVDHGDTIEYAVYGAEGELPSLPELRAAAGAALVEVTTTDVADDWASRWRDFHVPVTIGDRLHVRPPWCDPPAGVSRELLDIVIDPGNAFGTGVHPTTRLCLEVLIELEPRGALCDLGCGSGVLAIASARLGWGPVHAIDDRQEALAITRENALINGVDVRVRRLDLARGIAAPASATVLANILSPVLLRIAKAGFEGGPVETLVVGGMLSDEADTVVAAFAAHGLIERSRRELGGWATSVLARS